MTGNGGRIDQKCHLPRSLSTQHTGSNRTTVNSYPDSQLGGIRTKFHLQLLHKYSHLVENVTTEASDADCMILADFWKSTGSHPAILSDKEVNNSL